MEKEMIETTNYYLIATRYKGSLRMSAGMRNPDCFDSAVKAKGVEMSWALEGLKAQLFAIKSVTHILQPMGEHDETLRKQYPDYKVYNLDKPCTY
jgi:hypothetical protein